MERPFEIRIEEQTTLSSRQNLRVEEPTDQQAVAS